MLKSYNVFVKTHSRLQAIVVRLVQVFFLSNIGLKFDFKSLKKVMTINCNLTIGIWTSSIVWEICFDVTNPFTTVPTWQALQVARNTLTADIHTLKGENNARYKRHNNTASNLCQHNVLQFGKKLLLAALAEARRWVSQYISAILINICIHGRIRAKIVVYTHRYTNLNYGWCTYTPLSLFGRIHPRSCNNSYPPEQQIRYHQIHNETGGEGTRPLLRRSGA